MSQVQEEINALRKTEISHLREIIEKAEANGEDPLRDLQRKLKRQIAESKNQFETMHRNH